jgi:hypothetical protein
MYKNQVLVNGKERKFRTSTTDDKQIALERHEKAVVWAEQYSTVFGKSVTVNLFEDDNILYSVDYEY